MVTREGPSPGDLVVRRIPFEFPDDMDPVWHPRQREWSHMVNGASLTMPYLEPFLIRTIRAGLDRIDDDALIAQAKDFVSQESQHFRTHRRFNDLLKAKGPAPLADIEDRMAASYGRMEENRSLDFRLAYAAGFETMSLGMCRWLTGQRRRLFAGSDPRVASFILWHFVEEEEHKRVAFDVFQAASGSYWQRALGIFTGSLHVFWYSRLGCRALLRADGVWKDPRSRLRLWLRTAQFFGAVLPGAMRGLRRNHRPADEPDSSWARAWIAGYAQLEDPLTVPLVDTGHPDLPIPFPDPGAAA